MSARRSQRCDTGASTCWTSAGSTPPSSPTPAPAARPAARSTSSPTRSCPPARAGCTGPPPTFAYTSGTGDERHRLRAFIERHRPGAGDEQTAAQPAACARVWEQAGEDGSGRAWERRWRAFPRLLVVLVGTAASGMRSAVADLRLAAEKKPAVAEMLTAVPADAARIEDLVQRSPAAPIWHPLSSSGRACGWTEL
ncbi:MULTISPECIES: hypothetical protein [unclassified Kitasatospora]|uniref:hypothetical protein n=1 Tax=unclassified Kitasatospora TaxID=2633591 RepID=UPI0033FC9985